jgi:hypothetical protein
MDAKKDELRFDRRRFFTTAGVGITLPMLPSLLWSPNASAATCAPIKRFMFYHFPNGHYMQEHIPTGAGATWGLPSTMPTWAPYKQDITFITGLENQQRRRQTGDHALGAGALLTARMPTPNSQQMSMSVDQIIADAQTGCKGLASLQLGTGNGGPTDSFGTYFTRNISWRAPSMKNADGTMSFPVGAGTPLGKIIDAQTAFNKLFMGTSPTASSGDAQMRMALRKSVLDSVLPYQASLKPKLNPADSAKLDQLFTGIRSLEMQLQNAPAPGSCTPPTLPGPAKNPTDKNGLTGTDYLAQGDFMHSLIAVAFQCDITRVITFMLGDAVTSRNYSFVPAVAAAGQAAGGATSDHQSSHYAGNATLQEVYHQISLYKMIWISTFVAKMKAALDADGHDMLYNSAIVVSSEIGDGNRHNHDNLPTMVLGQLGGLIKPNRLVQYPNAVGTDYSAVKTYGDFYIQLLNLFDVKVTSFGNDGKEALAWNA